MLPRCFKGLTGPLVILPPPENRPHHHFGLTAPIGRASGHRKRGFVARERFVVVILAEAEICKRNRVVGKLGTSLLCGCIERGCEGV